MKTELVLKKTILLGFMLMAVSNVFANNANEKENTANVVIKRTINLIGYMSVSPIEDSYTANINVPIANDINQIIDKVIIII